MRAKLIVRQFDILNITKTEQLPPATFIRIMRGDDIPTKTVNTRCLGVFIYPCDVRLNGSPHIIMLNLNHPLTRYRRADDC